MNTDVPTVSTVYQCSWIRKSVFMVWFRINRQNIYLPSWRNRFSTWWWTFWSLIEHLPYAERYSGLVSQHCVPLQLDQNVCVYGMIQYKWLEHWLALMAKPVF